MKRLLAVTVLLVLFAGMGAADQAHYHLNETSGSTAFDYSGNSNDALHGGSPSLGVQGAEFGSGEWNDGLAYDFNGNSHVEPPQFGIFNGNSNFTLVSWVKRSSTGTQHQIWAMRQESRIEVRVETDDTVTFSDFDTVISLSSTTTIDAGEWYHVAAVYNTAKGSKLYINGTLEDSSSTTGSIADDANTDHNGYADDGQGGTEWDGVLDEGHVFNDALTQTQIQNLSDFNCISGECANAAPTIDANSTRPAPDQIQLNDAVDTVVNATDSDGDTMKGWVTVNEDGTDIVTDKSMSQPATGDFQDVDTFTADEINVWYNVTYTVGDGTANTTSEIRVFNEDNPPTVTINDPGNVTLYDYDNHLLNATIDDDLSTWANISVTVDGNNIVNGLNRTVKYFTTNTTRDDLGTHNLSVKAWDDQQQTTLAWEVFTVDDLKFFGTANKTPTYETFNESFNSSHKIGDMVDEFNTTLFWNNTDRFKRTTFNQDTITTVNDSHYFEIPLVDRNNTFVNWTIQRSYNRTDFNGGTSTFNENITKFGNQSVFHAYSFDNSELIPDSNYTTSDDYTHRVNLTNRSDKATVTATNTYWRTLNTVTNGLNKIISSSTSVYELGQAVGNVTTGLFDQYNTSTEFKIEFNGKTRFFNSTNDTVGVRQVKLQECSQFTQSSTVALNFTTRPETDRDTLAFSDLTGAFTVWKHPSQKQAYNFTSLDQQFHEFCIFPEDENLTVDNTDKLIQYEGSRPRPDNGTGFERRSYFLINETLLHTSTSTINLFMINETDATTVEYQIENEDGDLATGIVVKIERYFESEDKHLVVSMIRTGSEGTSRTFLEKNEFYYQHRLFRDMEQVDIKEDQVIPEDNQFNFQIGGETTLDYYERKDDVSFSCTDATTYINCSYSSDTEQLENVNLTVKRNDVVGQTLIDYTTATTTSGEVAVTGLNTTNTTYTYAFNAEFPEGTILLESGFLGTGGDLFGNTGLSLSLFLMLGLGFAGIAIAPEAVIILSMLGVVATATIDIIALQMQHVFGLILIAAVAVWRMMR